MTDLETAELKKALTRIHQALAIAQRWGVGPAERAELITYLSDAKGKLQGVLGGSGTDTSAMGASR